MFPFLSHRARLVGPTAEATVEFRRWMTAVEAARNLEACTVAKLPPAASVLPGTRGFVTDATATTFASTVAGGGANAVPVVSDGAAWKIG